MRNISKLGIALGALIALQASAAALVRIDVDLDAQTMRVAADTGERYEWPISSGRPGHATPRGNFRPRAMYLMVHSAKYGNAPMPHSIFFYGQYAIHGTEAVDSLGHVASHGCIRLAPENAAALYALVGQQGAQIRIVGAPPAPENVASAARRRHSERALGYAPRRRPRSLREWAADPLGLR